MPTMSDTISASNDISIVGARFGRYCADVTRTVPVAVK